MLDRLRYVAEAKKSFDAEPSWKTVRSRFSTRQELIVALRLNGVLRGGATMRLVTPTEAWESDVYGHVEVVLPGATRQLRLMPIEWRPIRAHVNPADAPSAHRLQILRDRWHPFEINAKFGMASFDQSPTGIAVPLPSDPSSFREYADLCARLWRCPEVMGVPPPPWTRSFV